MSPFGSSWKRSTTTWALDFDHDQTVAPSETMTRSSNEILYRFPFASARVPSDDCRAFETANTVVREAEHRLWEIHHKILDPEGDEDWGIEATVDLRVPVDESGPLIQVQRIGV